MNIADLVNQISTQKLGEVTKPQGFDLNDNTFENLLQKSLDKTVNSSEIQALQNFGAPAGMIIEPFDAPQSTGEIQPINTEAVQIKDINMDDFFTNIIKTQSDKDNSIFDFAKKHATNAYNHFGKGFVDDLAELAKDAAALS